MARRWALPAVVFALVCVAGQLAVGMRASRTASVTGDEPFYLLTAQSLVSDGDLDLRDEYRQREYERFWDADVPLWKQMEPAPDGRLLAPHEPGLPLLVAPAFEVAGLRGAQRFLVLLWSLAMAVAAVVATRLAVPPAAAGLAAVAIGVGAPGIVYASQVYPEGPAALAVAIALLAVTSDRARPVLIAVTLVALAWLGVKYGPVGAVLGAGWAWRFRSSRGAVAVAATIVAVAAAHYVWWHLDVFGGLTPYGTNVVWAGEGTAEVLDAHFRVSGRAYRLYGLFLDARFGLFRWLPLAVLAAWGVSRRTLAPVATLVVTAAVATFLSITMMGWWFPGRMLVGALPAGVVLAGAGIARLPRLGLLLSAWSVAIGVAVAIAAHSGRVRLAVDPFTLGAPLAPSGLFPDFRAFGGREIALSLAWGAAIGAGLVATRRRDRARSVAPAG